MSSRTIRDFIVVSSGTYRAALNLMGLMGVADAAITACCARLRPILMCPPAAMTGITPGALKLDARGEQHTCMPRAIVGGLTSSVILTVFIVPAACVLVYGHKERHVS